MNTPSSKNSKIKGKFFSATVQRYLRSYGIQSFSSRHKTVKGYARRPITFPVNELKELINRESNKPILLGFHFVRDSKRKFDFGNICQILLDLFTAFDIINDDNMDEVIPFAYQRDNVWYTVDKENPGVYIKILNLD